MNVNNNKNVQEPWFKGTSYRLKNEKTETSSFSNRKLLPDIMFAREPLKTVVDEDGWYPFTRGVTVAVKI